VADGYGENITYKKTDNITLLSEYHNVYKIKAQITENSLTSLRGISSLGKGRIKIGGITLYAGNTNAEKLIGYMVEAFYKDEEDAGQQTVISIYADEDWNNCVRFEARNIESYEQNKLTYKKKGYINISPTTSVILNGYYTNGFNSDLWENKEGTLTFITTRGSICDVVIADLYENFIIHNVVPNDKLIISMYDPDNFLMLADDETMTYSLKDTTGRDIKLSDLNMWDVLSVFKSGGTKTNIDIIVSGKCIIGTVNQITENEEIEVVVNQKSYILNRGAEKLFGDIIVPGLSGKFYLDYRGRLAAMEIALGKNIGFIMSAGNGSGLDTLSIKVFKNDKTVEIFQASDNIKIDGVKCKTNDDIKSCLKNYSENMRQIIVYELNNKRQISSIDTPYLSVAESQYSIKESYSKAELKWKSSMKTFSGKIILNDSTLIFETPDEESNYDDVSYYSVLVSGSLVNDQTYFVSSYNLDGDAVAAEIVNIFYNPPALNYDAPLYLIDKVTTAIDDEQNVVDKVYCMLDGNEMSFLSNNAGELSRLKSGDSVRFAVDRNGRVAAASIEKFFEYETKIFNEGKSGDYYTISDYTSSDRVVCGYVNNISGNLIQIKYGIDPAADLGMETHAADKYKISVYDPNSNGKLYAGTIKDILDIKHSGSYASFIVAKMRSGDARNLIIYKAKQ
jgi:hypothetical protein